MLKGIVCVVLAALATACAARTPARQLEPSTTALESSAESPVEPVEQSTGKTRAFSVRPVPPRSTVQMVEASDPALAAALLRAALSETAENNRAVAHEYERLGILDKADEYLSAAVEIDPRDGAAWTMKARLWLEWGWPHLALPHAIRAVHFAPSSHEARNILGAVLQVLGRHREARAQYEQALRLDAGLNRVCQDLVAKDQQEVDGRLACDLAYATGDKAHQRRSRGLRPHDPTVNRSPAASASTLQQP